MAVALELNDAGITAVRGGGTDVLAVDASPGYAVLDGDRILTGVEARRRSRLVPRMTHTRFWDALDTEPLGRPFPGHLSAADLAHAHLKSIWDALGDRANVMLAVPGWYSLDQLGLILGMAQACEMTVGGMIDAALAAAASVAEGRAFVHLDLHMHRVSATRVLRDQQLVREDTVVDPSVGLSALYDLWARLIAKAFIRQTRFDPLHTAASEQELYDRLPAWLDALADGDEATVTLDPHTAELSRAELVNGAAQHYDALVALARSIAPTREPVTLLVSHRLAELPGLIATLSRDITEQLVVLPAEAVAAGALLYESRTAGARDPEGGLTFLTRLSIESEIVEAEESPPEVTAPRQERTPTHLLYDGVAHPLDEKPFLLGVSIPAGARGVNLLGATAGISRSHCTVYRDGERVVAEDHSKFGSFVNGKRIQERAALAAGDRLRLGTPGIEVELIEVLH